MQTGTVKFYNFEKKFGFVTTDSGDVFFHVSGLSGTIDEVTGHTIPDFMPEEGQTVTFELEETDRGPKAINVTPVEGGAADASMEMEMPSAGAGTGDGDDDDDDQTADEEAGEAAPAA